MIKASHHWFYTRFFNWYIHRIMASDFHKVEIIGSENVEKKAVLMLGNHVSWWDGFWALYLNNQLFKKKIHVMMLEDQLRMRRFLSKFGAFSIDPNTRSVVESLNYSVDLLSNPNNLLVMYPQGKLHSMHQSDIVFERGIEKILSRCVEVNLMFYAAFVDYFSNRKPTLTIYIEQVEFDRYNSSDLNSMYCDFYINCRKKQALKAV